MTTRQRKGRVAAFSADDGIVDAHGPSSVTGLRFSIVARSGGTAQIDFTDLKPRPLAIEMAQAIRRLSEVGGPLGARSTILAYARTVRIFFRYLWVEAKAFSSSRQIEVAHIDGFEAWLEAEGKSGVHAFTLLSKIVVIFREIDANDPNRVSDGLRGRLRYTSARPFECPRPRDAYSPFVARQLRDAARADVAAIIRRLDGCLPEHLAVHSDPVICQRAEALRDAICRHGFLSHIIASRWHLFALLSDGSRPPAAADAPQPRYRIGDRMRQSAQSRLSKQCLCGDRDAALHQTPGSWAGAKDHAGARWRSDNTQWLDPCHRNHDKACAQVPSIRCAVPFLSRLQFPQLRAAS